MLNPIQTSHSFQVQPETEDDDPLKHESESAIQDSPSDNETPEYKWEEDTLDYISKAIQKTGERKVDSKLLEDFKSLEKLELSEKKRKVEELKKELNTIKTQTPRLFEELNNEVEKLITQIERETNTVSALRKHHATISEIINKIEENREQDPEIYKNFPKDPIRAIITKILADEPKIDEEFKKLFEADPDSITKIITPIVKENAIQKIITEIKLNASQDPQTEDDEFDSFRKIIEKILEENSLITKYYKRDPYSIAGIIDQLQSKKTVEVSVKDLIEKITTQILSENAKASQAIKEDPLGQIIIEHKKETSEKILSEIEKVNLTIESVKNSENILAEGNLNEVDPPKETFRIFGQEAKKGKVVHRIDPDLSQQIVDATILDLKPDQLAQIQKPSLISGLFSSQTTLKQNRYIALSYDLKNRADFVFVQLDGKPAPSTEVKKPAPPTEEEIKESVIKKQNIEFIKKIKEFAEKQAEEELPEKQVEEELAEKDEKGRSFDVKRLLIYAELIDKIPQEYSESISSIHQEIISLKKQEKDHKKTLVFLAPIIIREEEEERERKRIAKEEEQIGILEEKLSAVEEMLNDVQVKIEENEKEKKLVLEEEKRRQSALPSVVKSIEEQKTLQEKIREAQEKLETNSKIREGIEERIKEILSPEYVNEKLAHGPKESIMDQLIIEAIIVDEAKKLLRPDEIQEIETEILQQSPDNILSEAFNLLVLQKALEIKSPHEDQHEGSQITLLEYPDEIFTQQNINNFFSDGNQLFEYRFKIYELEVESKAIKDQIYNLDIALTGREHALPQVSALPEVNQASWVSAQQISASLPTGYQEQPAKPEESVQDEAGLESGSHSYQITTHEGQEKSVGTVFSDDLLGGVVHQENSQQFQNLESLYQVTENNTKYTNLLPTYDPFSRVLEYQPPLASAPQPLTEEQVLSAPLTTVTAIDFLKRMLKESSEEEPEVIREVVLDDSWQNSDPDNTISNPDNNLNQDSSQHGVPKDQLPHSQEHSPFEHDSRDNTTISLFNQALEDNKKKEIEEKKIKKSFSHLFLRCLLEKMESPVKENSDQNSQIQNLQTESNTSSEEETLSAKSFVQEEINLNPKEIFECSKKISDHLASEYQKLLEKLKTTKKIEGLQDDEGNDDKQSDQSSQYLGETQEPFEDPKIYCGVGIRMALEKETIDGTEQHYLKIVEIFQDSALSDYHINQKISEVGIKENGEIKFKSITDILADCGGDTNKFYAKISTIFHNPSEEKISLKFKADSSLDEAQKSPETFTKKLFRPDKGASMKMTNIDDIKDFTSNLSSNRPISNRLVESQTIQQ